MSTTLRNPAAGPGAPPPARRPGIHRPPRPGSHRERGPGGPGARGRPSWRVLRYGGFRLYFFGSLASNSGTWLQNTAQVLLAYQLTHSVFAVGAVTCAQFSSSLILSPTAAVVASRIGGRRLLIGTQLLSMGLAGGMAALQAARMLDEQLLIVGALGLGLVFTFALPVQTALVPRLVRGKADTEAAMAMNSVSYNAGRALAPALCVLVVITVGFTWVFAFNAISFGVFALALTGAYPNPGHRPARPSRLSDGARIALLQPRIALLLAMVAAVTIADDPILVLGPGLARHVFGTSIDWSGYFLSALGCGTVLGSLLPRRNRDSETDSATSRRAAISLFVLGIAIVVFSAGFAPAVSVIAALAAGGAALATGAATQTFLVRQRPEHAASVMALWAMAWAGSKPLASLTDGWLASHYGVLWAGVAMASPAMLLAMLEIVLPTQIKRRIKVHARAWVKRHPPALALSPPAL